MMSPEQTAIVALHDRLAQAYDQAMEQDPGNAWVRAAFRELVEEVSPAGRTILDFGCGTGTDSLWYASRGMQVLAYDNSPAMMAEVRSKCADEITSGRIVPCEGDYTDFLAALAMRPRGTVVTANFAVLNMIHDLRPLFSALGGWVEPGGSVVASVLNPFHWRDLRYPSRFRWALGALREGVAVRRGSVESYCHTMRRYREIARPHFVLEKRAGAGALIRIEKGRYDWSAPRGFAQRIERALWKTPFLAPWAKFWFLVFRRSA